MECVAFGHSIYTYIYIFFLNLFIYFFIHLLAYLVQLIKNNLIKKLNKGNI